jgi:hypothetical protein
MERSAEGKHCQVGSKIYMDMQMVENNLGNLEE